MNWISIFISNNENASVSVKGKCEILFSHVEGAGRIIIPNEGLAWVSHASHDIWCWASWQDTFNLPVPFVQGSFLKREKFQKQPPALLWATVIGRDAAAASLREIFALRQGAEGESINRATTRERASHSVRPSHWTHKQNSRKYI